MVLDEFLLTIEGYVDSLGDKSKRNVVQYKGRFSVTSESVDLAKVSGFGVLIKVTALSRVTLFFILNPLLYRFWKFHLVPSHANHHM
jgi:hypothetical protein